MISMVVRFVFHILWTVGKFILSAVLYPFVYPFRVWARMKQKTNKFAKLLWYFLDDTPEWSDAGGTWFYRNVCNNDVGVAKEGYGSWENFGLKTELHTTSKFRRFCCSYRWALRNPMTNFTESYEKLGAAEINFLFDTRTVSKGSKVALEDGKILRYKSVFGSYAAVLTDKYGKKHFRIDSAGIKKIPYGWFYWDIWAGHSTNRPHKFEVAPKIGFARDAI